VSGAGADDFRRAPLPPDLDRLLHDLRGPLNAAVMHLEVLKRVTGDDAMAHASLASIQQELERLTRMLPVAFSVCAIEMHGARPVALRAAVESAIDERGRARVVVVEGAWPQVDGDERLLAMALQQLIRNALEASETGEVRVSVEAGDGDTVGVLVQDTGPGFKARNPASMIRLMGTTKPGHLGVGLLAAQRIARLHGGALSLETRPEGGAVRLVLPVRRGEARVG
jgi:signal transduction histidine kinase